MEERNLDTISLASSARFGQWIIEGKAWDAAAKEPEKWDISFNEKAEPPTGRASVSGSPYSGTPIRYDDLADTALV